jgi:hypothetical protein
VNELADRVASMAATWVRDDDPRTIAEKLRQEDLGSGLLYLSAQPPDELPERFRAELAAARARGVLNRRLTEELSAAHPQAWIVKGTGIADLYGPLLRFSWDVDVVCRSSAELWAVASWLVDRHELAATALTVFGRAGTADPEYLVSLTGPDTDRWEWPLQVDIGSLFFVGDGRIPAPVRPTEVTGLSAGGRHLISVCLERFERRFVFKDAVDAGLLVERLTDDELAAVLDLVRRSDWQPEFAELLAAADRLGFPVRDRLPVASVDRLRTGLAPARRATEALGRHIGTRGRSLPQAVQYRALLSGGALSQRLWRRLSSAPGLAAPPAPAWFYGIPVRADRDAGTADPRLLETVVGTWYLTAGAEVDIDLLAQLGVSPAG